MRTQDNLYNQYNPKHHFYAQADEVGLRGGFVEYDRECARYGNPQITDAKHLVGYRA